MCPCGYKGEASAGATRATYLHSFFYPHACKTCREVVSVELAAKSPICPNCQSYEVIAYGSELPEARHKRWWSLSRLRARLAPGSSKEPTGTAFQYVDQSLNFMSQRRWGLRRDAHLCPLCGERSLHFELSAVCD